MSTKKNHNNGLDSILPFQIEPFFLRGRSVSLNTAANSILQRHNYPDSVAQLLAEMLVLAPCLSSSLKYDGVFTLQVRGERPVKTLLTDVTSGGAMRAYASYDAHNLPKNSTGLSLQQLTSGGYIAFTVDQKHTEERYQGIVELSKSTLTDCIHEYFRHSEQMETLVNLGVEKSSSGNWRGAAIMVQKEGFQGGKMLPKGASEDDYEEAWRNAAIMLASCPKKELLDNITKPDKLLYQLFHETGVRVYPRKILKDQCRCSVQKVEKVLIGLDAKEIESMKVDGTIKVTCEFCKIERHYDEQALAKLVMSNKVY